MVFGRSPPHLFLYQLFIQKKNNTNKDSADFESPGSQIFIEARCMKCLSALVSFCYYFHYIYIFLFSFYYGKLGMMGNFAGWRNERGCTRYVGYLPDGTYQSLNKDARVKLYIHKAKPCILLCSAPCASASFLDQGG